MPWGRVMEAGRLRGPGAEGGGLGKCLAGSSGDWKGAGLEGTSGGNSEEEGRGPGRLKELGVREAMGRLVSGAREGWGPGHGCCRVGTHQLFAFTSKFCSQPSFPPRCLMTWFWRCLCALRAV